MNGTLPFHRVSLVLVAGLVVIAGATGCASPDPAAIRVLTYNIHHGEGMDGRIDLDRIADVICGTEADLVALQEVDRGVERTERVDQPRRLGGLTGMHVVFEKNIEFQGGEYGNAVLSRFPVERHENHYLPRLHANEQRGLLEVHVRAGGRRIIFIATHFDHHPEDRERLASVAVLRDLVEQRADRPVIVAGDLNAVPNSKVMRQAGEFLCDTFEVSGRPGFTFPADKPTRRIDYILKNRHPGLRCVDRRVIAEAAASDHRPVLAMFTVESAQADSASRTTPGNPLGEPK